MTTPLLIPSKYQTDIYDWVVNGTGAACVIGVAGCAKTTTIIDASKLVALGKSILMLAFNRRIANALQARVPANVDARTFNSLGHRILTGQLGSLFVERWKVRDLCREYLSELSESHCDNHRYPELCPSEQIDGNLCGPRISFFDVYQSFICKIVALAKAMGIGALEPDDAETWWALTESHDIEVESLDGSEEEGIALAQTILGMSNKLALTKHLIDFEDQLYLPVLWGLSGKRYDWIFVDEAQDTNPVMRALLKMALKPEGRLMAVGDPNQAIYAFAGATNEAMDYIREDFSTIDLPLSISYRCAKTIVKLAQTLVPEIEAWDQSPEGEVRRLDNRLATQNAMLSLTPQDVILCRYNRPLVETAYYLIGENIGCSIAGSELGEGLISLINRMKVPFNLDDLYEKISLYRDRQVEKNMQHGREEKAEAIKDKVEALFCIMEHVENVPALKDEIFRLFAEKKGLLRLSTIHKAKGEEWSTVMIIRHHPWDNYRGKLGQEKNVRYVSYTRAKKLLILCSLDKERVGSSDPI